MVAISGLLPSPFKELHLGTQAPNQWRALGTPLEFPGSSFLLIWALHVSKPLPKYVKSLLDALFYFYSQYGFPPPVFETLQSLFSIFKEYHGTSILVLVQLILPKQRALISMLGHRPRVWVAATASISSQGLWT